MSLQGFDRSRPDIGAFETRVTVEDRIRHDRTTNEIVTGAAGREFFDIIGDNQFWELDPEVTRVGAILQAMQSRLYAQAEVTANDIERQWYLKRSMALDRFQDLLQVSSTNLTLEELRSRLRDVYMAYANGGSKLAYHQVVGAYTGLPSFITRKDDFPGYWRLLRSKLTGYATATSVPGPGLFTIGVASGTFHGLGETSFEFAEKQALDDATVVKSDGRVIAQADGVLSYGVYLVTLPAGIVPGFSGPTTVFVPDTVSDSLVTTLFGGFDSRVLGVFEPQGSRRNYLYLDPSVTDPLWTLGSGLTGPLPVLAYRTVGDEYTTSRTWYSRNGTAYDNAGTGYALYLSQPGIYNTLSWKAPSHNQAGPGVDIVLDGRYKLPSGDDPDFEVYVEVDTTVLQTAAGAFPFPGGSAFPVSVTPRPETCQEDQNWISNNFNATHGVVVECLGHGRMSEATKNELTRVLKDVADLGPLSICDYDLEEPGLVTVGESLSFLWPDPALPPFALSFPDTAPTFGTGILEFGDQEFPLIGPTDTVLEDVPIKCGPFLVIQPRYNQYEKAFDENFTLGPTLYWRVEDEIVSQPTRVTGVSLLDVSVDTPSGLGRLAYDAFSNTLQWQAPDPAGPDGLDSLGSSLSLRLSPPGGLVHNFTAVRDPEPSDDANFGYSSGSFWINTVTEDRFRNVVADVGGAIWSLTTDDPPLGGIKARGVQVPTPPGDGTLLFKKAGPPLNPNPRIAWRAFGDSAGGFAELTEDGNVVVISGNGKSKIYLTVKLSELPPVDTDITVTVTSLTQPSTRTDFTLFSGNRLFSLILRTFPDHIPTTSVDEAIRINLAELRTVPVLTTSLSATAVDFSLLDRVYSQNVDRRIFMRQGDSLDESDVSFTEFSEIEQFDQFVLTNPYIQFKITVENSPDFRGFPERDDYEFVSLAIRPTILPAIPECATADDFYRYVTSGLDADCGLYTDFGMISSGNDGFMSVVSSPEVVPPGFLLASGPLPVVGPFLPAFPTAF